MAHLSSTSMFDERKELIPEENATTVANVFVGSYPNVLVHVDQSKLAEFVGQVLALKT